MMTVDSHYPSPGGQVSEMAEVGGRRRRLAWCGSASPRPPQGLPRATPDVRLAGSAGGEHDVPDATLPGADRLVVDGGGRRDLGLGARVTLELTTTGAITGWVEAGVHRASWNPDQGPNPVVSGPSRSSAGLPVRSRAAAMSATEAASR